MKDSFSCIYLIMTQQFNINQKINKNQNVARAPFTCEELKVYARFYCTIRFFFFLFIWMFLLCVPKLKKKKTTIQYPNPIQWMDNSVNRKWMSTRELHTRTYSINYRFSQSRSFSFLMKLLIRHSIFDGLSFDFHDIFLSHSLLFQSYHLVVWNWAWCAFALKH